MKMNETTLFWAMVDGMRASTSTLLLEQFGSLANIPKDLSSADLQSLGMAERSATPLAQKMASVNLQKAEDVMHTKGLSVMSFEDEEFPFALKNIADAPLFLFYKGDISLLAKRMFAVVGTRSPSLDGKYAVETIVPPLVSAGMTIVSGMAMGVDTLAHHAALKAHGTTIAFLGSGLDMIYPSSNHQLFSEIVQNGIVFSEFPLGTRPEAYNFPRRNRLVSGISEGVMIVEGKEKSGSLITADFGMEQGKEIFAVPGSIRNPLSAGPHKLIADGATLVQSADDILSVFGMCASSKKPTSADPLALDPVQKKIYEQLSHTPLPFDILMQKLGMTSAELSSVLMMMMLLGVAEEVGGSAWVKK